MSDERKKSAGCGKFVPLLSSTIGSQSKASKGYLTPMMSSSYVLTGNDEFETNLNVHFEFKKITMCVDLMFILFFMFFSNNTSLHQ